MGDIQNPEKCNHRCKQDGRGHIRVTVRSTCLVGVCFVQSNHCALDRLLNLTTRRSWHNCDVVSRKSLHFKILFQDVFERNRVVVVSLSFSSLYISDVCSQGNEMLIDIVFKRKRLRRRCFDTWTAARVQQTLFFRGDPDSSFLRDGNVAAVHRIASAIHRSVAHSIAVQNVAGHYLFERVSFGTNSCLAADYRRTNSSGFDRCILCDAGFGTFGTGGRATWTRSGAWSTRATATSASGNDGKRHQQNCEGKTKSNCRQPHCGLTERLWHLVFVIRTLSSYAI